MNKLRTSLADAPDSDARLLPAHNEVRMVPRHVRRSPPAGLEWTTICSRDHTQIACNTACDYGEKRMRFSLSFCLFLRGSFFTGIAVVSPREARREKKPLPALFSIGLKSSGASAAWAWGWCAIGMVLTCGW